MNRVHVVFKTHLDLGFTDLAANVRQAYFERYIPDALRLAALTREQGGGRFVWTTGSWLIHEFLETQDAPAVRAMEVGIEHGDIRWHGLPFTTHSELMDASLFRHGLSLARRLDERFGRKTIAAKMTDVPGHSRAIVPLLAEAGVELLHLGVNPASSVPAVPPVFRWRHEDGTEVVVMYNGDYGGIEPLPGTDEALAFGHTGDNLGPQKPEEIAKFYAGLRERYPEAEIEATSLDAAAETLRPVRDQLPVVEDEIGDTWIHGVGTDPTKVRRFLFLSEARLGLPESEATRRGSDSLLCIAEHTWGRDIKRVVDGELTVEPTYEASAFAAKRAAGEYALHETSWAEQRTYVEEAQRLFGLEQGDAAPWEFESLGEPQPLTGSESLSDLAEGLTVSHQTFGSEDYRAFTEAYNPRMEETRVWAIPDFGKPCLDAVLERGSLDELKPVSVELGKGAVRIRLQGQGEGCPPSIEVTVFEGNPKRVQVAWDAKPASRIPEALWFAIRPSVWDAGSFRLLKLGSWIDPTRVASKAARRNHAVRGVRYQAGGKTKTIRNLDSALVSVGEPGLLRFDDAIPQPGNGMWFCLHNNVWGTNFPLWFGEPAFFRFVLE